MDQKKTRKLKMTAIAIGTVIIGGVAGIHIPAPYGPILAGLIALGGGFWLRSFFTTLKM